MTDGLRYTAKDMQEDDTLPVSFTYTNYRGETAVRKVIPGDLYFGSTQYYARRQWLLRAYDLDKQEVRDFAMAKIKDWRPVL